MDHRHAEYESFPARAYFYELMFADEHRLNANRGRGVTILEKEMFTPQFYRLLQTPLPTGYFIEKTHGRFLLEDGTTFVGSLTNLKNQLNPRERFLRVEIQNQGQMELHSFIIYHPVEPYQAVLTPLIAEEGVTQYYLEFKRTTPSN